MIILLIIGIAAALISFKINVIDLYKNDTGNKTVHQVKCERIKLDGPKRGSMK